MVRRKLQTNALYFTERLNQSLSGLLSNPLTIVEAPVGSGKATAVRTYLRRQRMAVVWFTVSNDSMSEMWQSFCQQLILRFPHRIAVLTPLMRSGMPVDIVHMEEAMRIIRSLDLRERLIVVLDQYDRINNPDMARFVEYMVHEGDEHLRLILLMSTPYQGNREMLLRKNLLRIFSADVFTLNAAELGAYFGQCGVLLSTEQMLVVRRETNGIIGIAYLHLLYYVAYQKLPEGLSVHDIVLQILFETYPEDIQHFFYTVALADLPTIGLVTHFWPAPRTKKELRRLCDANSLFVSEESMGCYRLHALMRNVVLDKYRALPPSEQALLWQHLGEWYENALSCVYAARAFYRAGRLDRALTMVASDKGSNISADNWPLVVTLLSACSDEVKSNCLPAVFLIAAMALQLGENELFLRELSFLQHYVNAMPDTQHEKGKLLGELVVLKSLSCLTDIDTLAEQLVHVQDGAQSVDNLFNVYFPWAHFAPMPSALMTYHKHRGFLEQEIHQSEDVIPRLDLLTHRGDTFYESLFKAEAFFFCGDMAKAEPIAASVEAQSRRAKQHSTTLMAMFLRLGIAMFCGEAESMGQLMVSTRELATACDGSLALYSVDLVHAWINANLGYKERIPDWIRYGILDHIRLPQALHETYDIVHLQALALHHEYPRLITSAERIFSDPRHDRSVMLQIYALLYASIAYYHQRSFDKALRSMEKALDLALPDGLILPFALIYEGCRPLLDLLTGDMLYQEVLEQIATLHERWKDTQEALRFLKKDRPNEDVLTAQEHEVAYWASIGLSEGAISAQLSLPNQVVHATRDALYAKLGVHSHAMLFQRIPKLPRPRE